MTPGGPCSCEANSAPRPDERFRPEERIRRRADYVAVYDGGRKIGGRLMTVFFLEIGRERPRLMLSSSVPCGKLRTPAGETFQQMWKRLWISWGAKGQRRPEN